MAHRFLNVRKINKRPPTKCPNVTLSVPAANQIPDSTATLHIFRRISNVYIGLTCFVQTAIENVCLMRHKYLNYKFKLTRSFASLRQATAGVLSTNIKWA